MRLFGLTMPLLWLTINSLLKFSTTTKLNGEAIFSLSTATGGEPGSQDAKLAFNNRVRLNLTSSFNGSDLLIVGLQAYNFSL
ncbi:carbohydrate porin [Nostoc sp. NMS4]|uniref:carbohydrate porin n=1 Tax=Nostoc sp. NMS4 TaxID=2815390 RepID=UPI0025DBB34D|nr:carbohydrate porin [Nostoc sp. NMS4]MBN3924529.1 carbohydrate porin [Nostoc sp. NMS4]